VYLFVLYILFIRVKKKVIAPSL